MFYSICDAVKNENNSNIKRFGLLLFNRGKLKVLLNILLYLFLI